MAPRTDAEMMYGDREGRTATVYEPESPEHVCVCGHPSRRHDEGILSCMAGTAPRTEEPRCWCPWYVGELWAQGASGYHELTRLMQLLIWAEAFGRRAA